LSAKDRLQNDHAMPNVDTDNPAPRPYRRAGMRLRRTWNVYSKCLLP